MHSRSVIICGYQLRGCCANQPKLSAVGCFFFSFSPLGVECTGPATVAVQISIFRIVLLLSHQFTLGCRGLVPVGKGGATHTGIMEQPRHLGLSNRVVLLHVIM